MAYVCINGEFMSAEEAKISVWDHGFLYGDGLFETMRAYGGKVFAFEEHLERMRQGAFELRLEIPQSDDELAALLEATLRHNNLSDAYIRLTYTRGPGPIGIDPALCPVGTLVIMARGSAVDDNVYLDGISLGICPVRRNHPTALAPAIKSVNFLNNILAKIWAKENGYSESLMLSQEGWLTESTVSNIFFVRDGRVFTPSLEVGILAGVTRLYAIQAVQAIGLDVSEGLYGPDDLRAAEEIFLTNSGSEIIPITWLDRVRVGVGQPGELTKKIHTSFRQIVSRSLV